MVEGIRRNRLGVVVTHGCQMEDAMEESYSPEDERADVRCCQAVQRDLRWGKKKKEVGS